MRVLGRVRIVRSTWPAQGAQLHLALPPITISSRLTLFNVASSANQVLATHRIAVGAVFFYAPREWSNALPESSLQGRLKAAIFPDKVIESDVEIRGLPTITES